MSSFQSRVSQSPVIGSVDLEDSQYHTWSYLVEIDMVTHVEWYNQHLLIFMVWHCLNKICNNFYSIYMETSSHHHLQVKICRRLLSLFMMSLLLHVPTHKMPNLLDTYNTYIKYIEEASFCGLTMRSSALERYPMHQDCKGRRDQRM
jgi:hypothetical protein